MEQKEENPPPLLGSISLTRFIDTALLLALATAILFFWGYAYFDALCSALGFPFWGIQLPLENYLITTWNDLFTSAMTCIAILIVLAAIFAAWKDTLGYKKTFSQRLREKRSLKKHFPRLYKIKQLGIFLSFRKDMLPLIRAIIRPTMAFFAIFVVLLQASIIESSARRQANKILEAKWSVQICDTSSNPILGNFVYYRDFGSVLVVGEYNEDMSKRTAIRFFPQGAYASYALMDKPAKEEKKHTNSAQE